MSNSSETTWQFQGNNSILSHLFKRMKEEATSSNPKCLFDTIGQEQGGEMVAQSVRTLAGLVSINLHNHYYLGYLTCYVHNNFMIQRVCTMYIIVTDQNMITHSR